jgi:pimeloyl-CoA dehydrogenase
MNFQPTDEQQQLARSLARLLDDHCGFEARRAQASREPGWSPQVWQRLAELGVTALGIPESCGGLDGGAVERLPVMQAFGRVLLLEPYLASAVLGATAVREAGSAAQRDALLPTLATGELRLAWAHDEAAGRHAPLWLETVAQHDGCGWRLQGRKSLVLHAVAAPRFVVSARVSGSAADSDGIALFLVDAASAGADLRPFRLVDDTPAGELVLDGAVAEPLGDPADAAQALAAVRATIAAGTAAVCADMVGAMETAFALTTGYLNTRRQFGRLIGEYQALRHRVAEMAVSLELARSMATAAAYAADDLGAPGADTDLSRSKLVVGKHARALCQAAIQSHGGIGMTEEYAVGHCLRRIHVLDQLFGDVHSHARRLARSAAH